MYHHGEGMEQSDSSAMRWYAKALAKAEAQRFEAAQAAIRRLISKLEAPRLIRW